MAVYTEVSLKEAAVLFKQLKLGNVTAMQGCTGGIENTNYFVTLSARMSSRIRFPSPAGIGMSG